MIDATTKGAIGCGDITDVDNDAAGFADPSLCNIACSGDPIHLCGGEARLQVRLFLFLPIPVPTPRQLYEWNGVMNDWHTPENTGRYEVSSSRRNG